MLRRSPKVRGCLCRSSPSLCNERVRDCPASSDASTARPRARWRASEKELRKVGQRRNPASPQMMTGTVRVVVAMAAHRIFGRKHDAWRVARRCRQWPSGKAFVNCRNGDKVKAAAIPALAPFSPVYPISADGPRFITDRTAPSFGPAIWYKQEASRISSRPSSYRRTISALR